MSSSMQLAILEPAPGDCPRCNATGLRDLMAGAVVSWPLRISTGWPAGMVGERRPAVVLLCQPSARTLDHARAHWPEAPVIGVFCAPERIATFRPLLAVLDDFVLCPVSAADLAPRVERFLPRGSATEPPAAGRLVRDRYQLNSLVGESDALLTVVARLPVIANSTATCLVAGETGTGKELFARALHFVGARRNKPFIPVNCGALPDPLFENELFGHVRGAYTDAGSFQEGVISLAEGGTLFLDEVDALSPSAQIKLLRFLQDHEYRPLGSARAVSSNLRVITATNAPLHHLVTRHLFREDLFHRLNVLRLTIPPLRERLEDIPRLAQHFIQMFAREARRSPPRLSAAALRLLLRYPWPGNIRELEGVIHRAVILSESDQLGPEEIELLPPDRPSESAGSFRDAKRDAIDQFERRYLVQLLAEHDGNVTRAARSAGKERSAFQRLLRKHSLGREAPKPFSEPGRRPPHASRSRGAPPGGRAPEAPSLGARPRTV
jgi:DNA-binding NtrC family response regulator